MDNNVLLSIYKYVIEKGDMGICVVDTEGKLLIYNKKMRELESPSFLQHLSLRSLTSKYPLINKIV